MSRRLLDTRPGYGLWLYNDHNGVSPYKVWEPLKPELPNLSDVTTPLASSVQPAASLPGGLYGQSLSKSERRSAEIDEGLRALGMSTPRRCPR